MTIRTLIFVNLTGFSVLIGIVAYAAAQIEKILTQIRDNAHDARVKADKAAQKAAEAQNIAEAQLRVRGDLRNPSRDDSSNDH